MKYLYKNKHWEPNEEYNLDKLLYLMIDRPNEINYNNNEFVWINNKSINRDYDLPAYVYQYKNKIRISLHWYKNSKLHRKNNKPAHIS